MAQWVINAIRLAITAVVLAVMWSIIALMFVTIAIQLLGLAIIFAPITIAFVFYILTAKAGHVSSNGYKFINVIAGILVFPWAYFIIFWEAIPKVIDFIFRVAFAPDPEPSRYSSLTFADLLFVAAIVSFGTLIYAIRECYLFAFGAMSKSDMD